MEKISIFIEKLSFREKALFFILCAFVAGFLGFNLYNKYFDDELIFRLSSNSLEEKKEQILALKDELNKLNAEFLKEQENAQNYESKSEIFKQNINELLSFIKEKSANLKLVYLKENEIKEEKFNIYVIEFKAFGEFNELINFINLLENSRLKMEISKIYFDNISDIKLSLILVLKLIKLE